MTPMRSVPESGSIQRRAVSLSASVARNTSLGALDEIPARRGRAERDVVHAQIF